jgi:AsmA family protein
MARPGTPVFLARFAAMRRLGRIAPVVVAVLLVAVGGGLAALKSDLPRSIAEKTASAKLERAVHLGGLDIAFSPRFRIIATDVTVANMATGTTANMVEIARAETALDPWKLLRGQLDIALVSLDRPVIVAEKDEQGRANWQLHPEQPAGEMPKIPIRQLVINDGRVTYRDPIEKINVGIHVQSQPAGGAGADRLALAGDGRVGPNQIKLSGMADAALNVPEAAKPYAAELEGAAGQTRARIAAISKEPLRAQGLEAELHLEARDAYDFHQLTGIAIPPTPPYKFDGRLYREGDVWRLEPFSAQVGKSDLRGRLAVNTGGERPKLSADLTTKRLVLADFIGGGDRKGGGTGTGVEQVQRKAEAKEKAGAEQRKPPPKASGDTVIPDTKIEPERLKAIDAAVKFRGTRIESPIVPLTEVATEIVLDDGLLTVKPLRFGLDEGKVELDMSLNGRKTPAVFNAVMNVHRVPVGDMLRALEQKLAQAETSSGIVGGRAEIRAQGNSLKALLASSNGNLGLAMEQGRMGLVLTKIVDLHVVEALGVAATGNKPIPIRCKVVDFEIIDGVMGSRAIVIDTTDSNISGEGAINFKTEEINFRIVPRAKSAGMLSARTPVGISGTLGNVSIRPEATPLAARLGAAAVLGAVATPFAVPLAFVDAGLGKDGDCAAMIRELNAGIEKQKREGAKPETPSDAPERPKR